MDIPQTLPGFIQVMSACIIVLSKTFPENDVTVFMHNLPGIHIPLYTIVKYREYPQIYMQSDLTQFISFYTIAGFPIVRLPEIQLPTDRVMILQVLLTQCMDSSLSSVL